MNEIRSNHLVERAAVRLRDEFGLSGNAPVANAPAGGRLPGQQKQADPGSLPASPPPPPLLSQAAAIAAEAPDTPSPAGIAEPVAMAVLQRAGLALAGGRRTRVAEEFSVTAGNLLRTMRGAQASGASGLPGGAFGNLLLVSSAKPGEGKTFSSLNLAATLANSGLARVVLVDVDPKPGSLTTLLGLEGHPGLFNLAADPALKPDAVTVGTAIRDLSVLPLGARAAALDEQGSLRKMIAAIERIARRFAGQIVILDAPPCLATSEPAALAPMVGLVAVVVEAERTQREDLENALDLVKTCPNLTLLLNKTRGARGQAFGDYDYYGA